MLLSGVSLQADLDKAAQKVNTFSDSSTEFDLVDTATLARLIQRPDLTLDHERRALFDGLDRASQILLMEAESCFEKMAEFVGAIPRVYSNHHSAFTVSEKISLLRQIDYLDEIHPHLEASSFLSPEHLKDLREADGNAQLANAMPDEVQVTETAVAALALMRNNYDVSGVIVARNPAYQAQWRAIEMAILAHTEENRYDLEGRDPETEYFHREITSAGELRRNLLELTRGARQFYPVTVTRDAESAWVISIIEDWRQLTRFAGHGRGLLSWRAWYELDVELGEEDYPHQHDWAATSIWTSGDGETCLFNKADVRPDRAQLPKLDESAPWYHPENIDWLKYLVPGGTKLLAGRGAFEDGRPFIEHEMFPFPSHRPRILFRLVVEHSRAELNRWQRDVHDQSLGTQHRLHALQRLRSQGL